MSFCIVCFALCRGLESGLLLDVSTDPLHIMLLLHGGDLGLHAPYRQSSRSTLSSPERIFSEWAHPWGKPVESRLVVSYSLQCIPIHLSSRPRSEASLPGRHRSRPGRL